MESYQLLVTPVNGGGYRVSIGEFRGSGYEYYNGVGDSFAQAAERAYKTLNSPKQKKKK